MEIQKGADKKSNSIMKKLERYLSSTEKEAKPSTKTLTEKEAKPSTKTPKKMLTKSKSLQPMSSTSRGDSHHGKANRNGCFSVYVGPEKQRFVIKAKVANHPLFKMLLEDAEMEYGFDNGGPLLIPCDVDTFYKVLADMDCVAQVEPQAGGSSHGRGSHFIARTRSSCEDELLAEIQKQI